VTGAPPAKALTVAPAVVRMARMGRRVLVQMVPVQMAVRRAPALTDRPTDRTALPMAPIGGPARHLRAAPMACVPLHPTVRVTGLMDRAALRPTVPMAAPMDHGVTDPTASPMVRTLGQREVTAPAAHASASPA